MKFQRTEPTAEYRILRLLSEAGRWELGLSDYQYGMRLRMGLMGRPPSVIDFCLGKNPQLYGLVLDAVIARLMRLEEISSAAEIDTIFPWAGTRPDPFMHLDQLLSGNQEGSFPLGREK